MSRSRGAADGILLPGELLGNLRQLMIIVDHLDRSAKCGCPGCLRELAKGLRAVAEELEVLADEVITTHVHVPRRVWVQGGGPPALNTSRALMSAALEHLRKEIAAVKHQVERLNAAS